MATSISLPTSLPAQPLHRVAPAPVARNARVAEQRRFVTRLVARFGVPAADVEDAAQDVFLISCRRQVELTGDEDRHGWLYLAARNVCLNRRRSLRREAARRCFPLRELETERDERACLPDQRLETRELCQLLSRGLSQLSDEQREAVQGALEGRSAAQIAIELGAPVATVASRLRASRLALRRHLHRHGWPVRATLTALQQAA